MNYKRYRVSSYDSTRLQKNTFSFTNTYTYSLNERHEIGKLQWEKQLKQWRNQRKVLGGLGTHGKMRDKIHKIVNCSNSQNRKISNSNLQWKKINNVIKRMN